MSDIRRVTTDFDRVRRSGCDAGYSVDGISNAVIADTIDYCIGREPAEKLASLASHVVM